MTDDPFELVLDHIADWREPGSMLASILDMPSRKTVQRRVRADAEFARALSDGS